ncbi:MAG: polyketide synthase dehydratase domain-containing protein, partial [Rubricoccaceae bacterium]|nr:polyketide synthase dehydratase domain-containing protein [Rubricoccaceae bacterium]
AANAFLNGYAEKKSLESGPAYTSVNWGIWRDVGMASRLVQEGLDERLDEECTETVDHALITKRAELEDKSHLFEGSLERTRDWVVAEHQVHLGGALLPGTAFLDMACSAYWLANSDRLPVELSNVTLPSPLPVEEKGEREFRVLMSSEEGKQSFMIASEQGGQWVVNAIGFSTEIVDHQLNVDIADLMDRCSTRVEIFDAESPRSQQSEFLRLGERWNCVQKIQIGEDELLATLRLQPQFEQDLEDYCLHPALLDMATGVGLDLLESPQPEGLFAPLAYDSVRIWKPLPCRFYSYVRLIDYVEEQGIARFDVRLFDDMGEVLVDIIGMTMKLIEADQLKDFGQTTSRPSSRTPLEDMIDEGIRTEEGMKALDLILSAETPPVLIASPFSLPNLSKALQASSTDARRERSQMQNQAAILEPRDDIEGALVDLWSELLGVEQVSIKDNFFDLGGHSLLAVRLFARLEKRFGKALPLATLFEAATPELLANLLRGGELTDFSSKKNQTNGRPTGVRKSYDFLVPIQTGDTRRLPFFCVHGAGGNVLNFRDLAVRIGQDLPFYGLKARGADGEAPPHESIEEMAEAYLEEVVSLQPDSPYLLGGYSGGGVVAYEMAQQLRRSGKEVGLLVFLDTFRPGIVEEQGVTGRKANIARLIDRGPGYLIDWAKRRMEYERWKRTKQQMDSMSEQELPLPLEMREIQMTSAYHNAVDKYRIEVLDSVPVVLYTARDRAAEHDHVSDHLGWDPFIAEGLQIEFVPGDHDSLMREPNVSTLAKRLKRRIEKAVTGAITQSPTRHETATSAS